MIGGGSASLHAALSEIRSLIVSSSLTTAGDLGYRGMEQFEHSKIDNEGLATRTGDLEQVMPLSA